MYTIRDVEHLWRHLNATHWQGRLSPPVIRAAAMGEYEGLCGRIASTGQVEIIIRANLLEGSADRLADLLLHEMIHQAQRELFRDCDSGHDGHGPVFCAEAWRITPALAHRKRWRSVLTVDSCQHWPGIIRTKSSGLAERVRW